MLRATLAWLLGPTPARSARVLQHMHAGGHRPSAASVEWMTLVARHTRSAGAPRPLPTSLVRRRRGVPRAVLCGGEDCFLPVRPLGAAVRAELRSELQVLAGAGHLVPAERPHEVVAAVARLG